MKRGSVVAALIALWLWFGAGCGTQQYLTGEPVLFGIRNRTGELVDRDLATENPAIHKGEIITLMANSVFVKLLKDSGNPDVLAYVEVYDDGSDDPDRAYRRVIYKGANTPQGVLLGVSDKVVYGPTPYKGFPLRIKLYVVELDKDEKKQVSQLISAVGSIAQASQPQYATAIGVVMRTAQALNQLNEDDFELRFDMTLFPTSPAFTYDIAHKDLARAGEPMQRQQKQIHLATPLRAGSFAVLKRELPKRFSDSFTNNADLANSTLLLDPAQEGFLKEYTLAGKSRKTVTATELLRFQGGYLYHLIAALEDDKGKSLPSATVLDPDNPANETVLVPGIRQFYRERTYVAFTLLNGLPEGLDDTAMRSTSNKQLEQIRNLLDNPDQLPVSTQLKPFIDNLTSAVVAGVEVRKLANQAARRNSVDSSFRTNGAYPVFWLQNLAVVDEKAEASRISKNTSILATVSEIVVNLPPAVKPDSTNCLTALKSLVATDFTVITNHAGYFNLTTNALEKLKDCK